MTSNDQAKAVIQIVDASSARKLEKEIINGMIK